MNSPSGEMNPPEQPPTLIAAGRRPVPRFGSHSRDGGSSSPCFLSHAASSCRTWRGVHFPSSAKAGEASRATRINARFMGVDATLLSPYNSRVTMRYARALTVVLLILGSSALAADLGRAAGSVTIDGKPIVLQYAY